MFRVVKDKFISVFSPSTESFERRSRKRRCPDPDPDPDCHITYSTKRRKQESTLGLLKGAAQAAYNFVIGKVSPLRIENIENGMNRDAHKQPRQPSRVLSTPIQTIPKRTGLSQISKSEVFNVDDEDDDSGDVIATKEILVLTEDDDVCDETSSSPSDIQLIETPQRNPALTNNYRKEEIHIKFIETSQRNSALIENFRQDEKKRYKNLLAHHTLVTCPEYSDSISPTKTSPITDDFAENVFTSPLFSHKSFQKSIHTIDLTTLELKSPLRQASKKYIDLTRGESNYDIRHESINEIFEVPPPPPQKKTDKVSPLMDPGWVDSWRKKLEPMDLERHRQIRNEERKLEALKKKQLEEIEQLSQQGKDELPELTSDMLSKVKRALAPGNPKEVFVSGFNAEITRGDIATLRNATWLNDEVVNFYFNLVKSRSESESALPKVHVFNTFFYPKIMKTGHAGVKRWTRKVDIFAVDVILIPIHLGMHWCLAVVDFKNKEIVYYDSLKGNNGACIQGLKKYLSDESRDKKKTEFDFTGWKELMPKDIPEQMNGCDCGVFMCKYAEYKSRFAKFTFTQDNMPYFRQRMIYEILTKKLM